MQKAVVEFYKRQNLVIPMKSIAARPSISISEENFTTKNYLLAIKEALDSSKYTLFTKSLMNFSERKISALEMIHNVHEAIFSESTVLVPLETRRTLFLLFKHFLPSKYHQNHSELIK